MGMPGLCRWCGERICVSLDAESECSLRMKQVPRTPRKARHAICGACGAEEIVSDYMRNEPAHQFTPQPDEATDLFYCGCQHEPEDGWPPNPRFL